MSKLYTPQMLALATELAACPLGADFSLVADGRSSVCGSALAVGIDLDAEGRVSRMGLRVSACAVGQASAAILAGAAEGTRPEDIRSAFNAVQKWLEGEGERPAWPRFDALAAALEHPGRHGALILPWETATRALSSALSPVPLSSRSAAR